VAGEMAEGPRTGAVGVIKELGFKGLYKVSDVLARHTVRLQLYT